MHTALLSLCDVLLARFKTSDLQHSIHTGPRRNFLTLAVALSPVDHATMALQDKSLPVGSSMIQQIIDGVGVGVCLLKVLDVNLGDC